jgi:hypothetical protein
MKPSTRAIVIIALFIVMPLVGTALHWPEDRWHIGVLFGFVCVLGLEIEKLKETANQATPHPRDEKIIKQLHTGKAVEPKHHPPMRPPCPR